MMTPADLVPTPDGVAVIVVICRRILLRPPEAKRASRGRSLLVMRNTPPAVELKTTRSGATKTSPASWLHGLGVCVCSLCTSYVDQPVLQPLYQRSRHH